MNYKTIFVAMAGSPSEPLVQFYIQLLGQLPDRHIPNVYAEFHLAELRLGIFQPQASHQAEFASSAGSMSLCLEVAQLEATMAQLTQLGYPPRGDIMTTSHGREIYAYDPAGNRLILHESSHSTSSGARS